MVGLTKKPHRQRKASRVEENTVVMELMAEERNGVLLTATH